ncbi:MAG: tRNA pseudouridine38-40 synthase [Fusobacteriaceae bacterium]|nr:tRNA pseudouridine38-40 synthase [Fusobacteriaceae bacterium]
MRNIKITYQYDGSDFYGLQKLKNRRTVQGEFEKFLKIIFKEEIKLISAGRTDRGVHALFQVSNFVTKNMSLDIKKLKYILNRGLPNDINILNIEEVELDFHSRFCVQDRAYIYKMSHIKNPFKHKKIKIVREKIDVNKLQEILNPLIGEHDFDSFRK